MLRTAGHVRKYYKPCCLIFEEFKNRGTENATLGEYMKAIEKHCEDFDDGDKILTFKGDMLEILAELIFKAFPNDPKIGLVDYEPVPLEDDYGVDGFGVNAAGKKVPVQVKYRSNPTDDVLYAEVSRTYTSAQIQLRMEIQGENSIYVLTTANKVTTACKTVFGNMLRVINGETIRQNINNNKSFWELAYEEVKETLLSE